MPPDFAPGLAAERLFGIFALWHSPSAFHWGSSELFLDHSCNAHVKPHLLVPAQLFGKANNSELFFLKKGSIFKDKKPTGVKLSQTIKCKENFSSELDQTLPVNLSSPSSRYK